MRSILLLATVLAVTGCAPPDYLLASFDFNMTGTETQTAPQSRVDNSSGTGTMAVTVGKKADYVVTLAQTDATPCVIELDRNEKGDTVSVVADQKCTFVYSGGNVTATMTGGTITVSEKGETATLEVTYSYVGTTFGINYAGNGKRTYAGNRR